MKAYVEEVRALVVAAVLEKGLSRATAAGMFGLSVPTVGRYVRTRLAGASLTPRRSSGRPKKLCLGEQQAALRAHLEAEPDMELAERCDYLAAHAGISCSRTTLWRELRALDWTRKKRLSPPASKTG